MLFRQADRFTAQALQGVVCGGFTLPDRLPTDCRPGTDHCSHCPDRVKSYLHGGVIPDRTGRVMTAGRRFSVLSERWFFISPDRFSL